MNFETLSHRTQELLTVPTTLVSIFPLTQQGCPTVKLNSSRLSGLLSNRTSWLELIKAHRESDLSPKASAQQVTNMENQDTPAPVPILEDKSKVKEQVIDPWNVSGEVGEDGNVKPIGMWFS
jgi:hypothetical protein